VGLRAERPFLKLKKVPKPTCAHSYDVRAVHGAGKREKAINRARETPHPRKITPAKKHTRDFF
jgi:hypothetical protein